MFRTGVRDLVKKQWVAIIDSLKRSGGASIPELRREIGGSYMGIKDQCQAMVESGHLETWRVPRTAVGRPEVMYRLTQKAEILFPDAGPAMTLEILESARKLFGATAPERLLLQYFQELCNRWRPKLGKAKSLVEKATLLSALRESEGCFGRCRYEPEKGFWIEEYHHPLRPIFEVYPRAIQFELRMIEDLLGTKVIRQEVGPGDGKAARVDYEVHTLGVRRTEQN